MKILDKNGVQKDTDFLYLKASFTVEGSFIISFCIIILMSLIMLSYRIFYDTEKYIKDQDILKYDAVKTFRAVAAGENIIEKLKEKGKK
ncbi:MAG: hypothetical protein ILP08_08775 [Lachnospiraceae bacterium]|jgi:uncharacterized membrane protein YidH (DUF202 family)|nr:hypothetical protein [Lachnospiraceae bacterium]